jgi:hypothetical protein
LYCEELGVRGTNLVSQHSKLGSTRPLFSTHEENPKWRGAKHTPFINKFQETIRREEVP